ncbi:CCA tRNA nucleotidyltransferase [Clostridium guangxiense]|uniref:CCA tRNA nucleotidyltransferase n=1 Tax=Clostridium guangxiense TaxID=1662055 RepID=UPI001E55E791|nr:HD domain-containing protein [Clostridium guangxiense]MCD2348068.1 HD domain-containing protein [Clostridium guangxiense]
MIEVPEKPSYVVSILQKNKFKAYIVGGCVRDSLLLKEPNDWDIATSAKPEDMIKIFEKAGHKVIPTGLKHGTVTVMIDKNGYEITTFRIDGEYSDGRHPDSVEFTDDLKEDLSRRDFTINSMAYNEKDGLVDYFNGYEDLNNKVVRCVGNPDKRFNEDALRMLRAIRFSAQLSFKIEEKTAEAIKSNHSLIKKVSVERIQNEINKILMSHNPNYLANLYDYQLLDYIIPEYSICFKCEQNNPNHIYNVGVHIEKSLGYVEGNLPLRLTMLFHDIGKPLCKTRDDKGIDHFYGHQEKSFLMAENILKRLKYDNATIEKVKILVKFHDVELNTFRQVRKVLSIIGERNFIDLLKIKEADIRSQNPEYYEERHEKINLAKEMFKKVIAENNCFKLKDLAVNGRDLINIGIKDGRLIGKILNKLLEIVIEKPETNNKSELLRAAKDMLDIFQNSN